MKAVPIDSDCAKGNRDALANGLQTKRIGRILRAVSFGTWCQRGVNSLEY